MVDFPSGYLVFHVSNTLLAVHKVASQIGRLNSDAHLLDVGLLTKDAWVAAWVREENAAQLLAKQIGGECVALSANAAKALMSLGPGLSESQSEVGLLETLSLNDFAEFFRNISDCERCGWQVLEIRVRKSGLAGAHAFFEKSQSASSMNMVGFAELKVEGDYRKFF